MAKSLFSRLKFVQRNWKSADQRAAEAKKRAQAKANAPLLKAMNSARAIANQGKPKIEPMSAYQARIDQRSKENVDAWKDGRDVEMGQHGVLSAPSDPVTRTYEWDRERKQHDDTARALNMPTRAERQTRNQIAQAKIAAAETIKSPRPQAPRAEAPKASAVNDLVDKAKSFLRASKPKTRNA